MNKNDLTNLTICIKTGKLNLEGVSATYGLSVEKVDLAMEKLLKEGLLLKIQDGYSLTEKAKEGLKKYRVDNAVILAAGFGSRFVPITDETPKGLIKVRGEKMIERTIRQLREVDVTDITVVVGYMREKFEFLVDKYGVKLVYNDDYDTKNNLASLYHARHLLRNTYILCCDNYLAENIFETYEWNSWYSAVQSDTKIDEDFFKVDSNDRILEIAKVREKGWYLNGSVYFSESFSRKIVPLLEEYYMKEGTDDFYWDDILKENLQMLDMRVKYLPKNVLYEFDTLEELRAFDPGYGEFSNSRVMMKIASMFNVKEKDIKNITPRKMGLANKSFLFEIDKKRYICQLPGQGTEFLIDRTQEHME